MKEKIQLKGVSVNAINFKQVFLYQNNFLGRDDENKEKVFTIINIRPFWARETQRLFENLFYFLIFDLIFYTMEISRFLI